MLKLMRLRNEGRMTSAQLRRMQELDKKRRGRSQNPAEKAEVRRLRTEFVRRFKGNDNFTLGPPIPGAKRRDEAKKKSDKVILDFAAAAKKGRKTKGTAGDVAAAKRMLNRRERKAHMAGVDLPISVVEERRRGGAFAPPR